MKETRHISHVPLPPNFVDLAQHPKLLELDESLTRTLQEHRVKRPEDLAQLDLVSKGIVTSQLGILKKKYRDLYQNDSLFQLSRDWIKALTTDKIDNPPRTQIVDAYGRLRDDTIQTDLELDLLDWRVSRPARIKALCTQLNFEPQAGYRLYRGVQDQNAKTYIPNILKAWSRKLSFSPTLNALTSWSYKREPAERFARHNNTPHGAVLVADVPVQQIIADKLFDGGNFLLWWHQYEAIVGAFNKNDPVIVSPQLCIIMYDHQWYTISDYERLTRKTSQS